MEAPKHKAIKRRSPTRPSPTFITATLASSGTSINPNPARVPQDFTTHGVLWLIYDLRHSHFVKV
ncbi:uncharacterized protein G2W53_008163 [Senna tora]|uniref:Uncharacterized protein n=1 Tax=Senna tora TaxID=362788 RepID=A0A835CEE3_9FABA|nr:uncharacterized protein G2W53_008163 [Senna tora]